MNPLKYKPIPRAIFLACIFMPLFSIAQTDATRVAEAKYAIETAKDCKAAKQALDEVSAAGRNQQLYIYYAAKAYDCLGDNDNAIIYYNKYLEYMPNNADIIKRVTELSYAARKEKEYSDKYLTIFTKWFSTLQNKTLEKAHLRDGESPNNFRIDEYFNVWSDSVLVFRAEAKKPHFDFDGGARINGNLERNDFLHTTNDSWDKDELYLGYITADYIDISGKGGYHVVLKRSSNN